MNKQESYEAGSPAPCSAIPVEERGSFLTLATAPSQQWSGEHFYRDLQALICPDSPLVQSLILICIDLCDMDLILRTYGPWRRDLLLAEARERLEQAVGPDFTLYQINQARFGVLLHNRPHKAATRLANAVAERFCQPFDLSGHACELGIFVGISSYPQDAGSAEELVRTSVFAAHLARGTGRGYSVFNREADELSRHRHRLLLDLEKALANGREITAFYQPQVDLRSGKCVGVEALCRWRHPRLGLVPPCDFIPLAESTWLMMPLTEAVLAEGLKELEQWQSLGFHGSLALNLSPVLFHRDDLFERLKKQVLGAGVGFDRVDLEITENGIVEPSASVLHNLERFRREGGRIAVDDFGKGHSSLAYLARFPVDVLKIDKYFVQNMDTTWGRAIVGAATYLARQLGLQTVAEGIETERQLEECRELGVNIAQGFHLARPMAEEDFRQWLRGQAL